MIDQSKFEEAIKLTGREAVPIPVLPEVRSWLGEFNLDPQIRDFLISNSYTNQTVFRQVYFNHVNSIKENNFSVEDRRILENSKLIVGTGCNGDPLVIDTRTGKVSFVDHDLLYDEDEDCDFDVILSDLNESIGSYFLNLMTIEDYPIDSYFEDSDLIQLRNSNNSF